MGHYDQDYEYEAMVCQSCGLRTRMCRCEEGPHVYAAPATMQSNTHTHTVAKLDRLLARKLAADEREDGTPKRRALAFDPTTGEVIDRRPHPVAPDEPIPMVLHCPSCGLQHIDAPDSAPQFVSVDDVWTNPPHRSHLCCRCGTVWRPADVPTNGVERIATQGKGDKFVPWPTTIQLLCNELSDYEDTAQPDELVSRVKVLLEEHAALKMKRQAVAWEWCGIADEPEEWLPASKEWHDRIVSDKGPHGCRARALGVIATPVIESYSEGVDRMRAEGTYSDTVTTPAVVPAPAQPIVPEPSIRVDDIVEWLKLPENKARIENSLRLAAEAIAELDRARVVSFEMLHTPMSADPYRAAAPTIAAKEGR